MEKIFKSAFLLLIFALYLSSFALAEKQNWYVKQEHFTCLQNELKNYLAQSGDQFVIFISECPERDVVAILLRKTQNSSQPAIKKEENTPSNPAEVITFSRKELECVANLQIETSQKIISIPRNPCQ